MHNCLKVATELSTAAIQGRKIAGDNNSDDKNMVPVPVEEGAENENNDNM